jgi:hypothetical protein
MKPSVNWRTLASLLLIVTGLGLSSSCAVLEEIAAGDGSAPGSGEARIAEGLREALRVGSERAARQVGQTDGYRGNARIRIPLPESMQSVAAGLRRVGLGRQVDELELAMNRAAESAAHEAVNVFAGAIRQMRPADVQAVFTGGEDAATRYLRASSGETLKTRYRPIVTEHLERVQGMDLYRDIVTTWNRLPGVQPLTVDLDEYVTDRALDGLFQILADEERRIREDPVARTTQLLREVFG